MEEELKFLALKKETSLELLLLITASQALLLMMMRSLGPYCALLEQKHYRKALT